MKKVIYFGFVASLLLGSSLVAENKGDAERSKQLFREAAKVFQHPRCLNCHPAGSRPTQGDDMHVHTMNVQRGPTDHGMVGMQCLACHGQKNNENSNVPGAPKWGLAPRSMGWQGLSVSELCRAIKDPKKNHKMTLEQLIEHNAKDPLVGWGWNPGKGRTPVPGTQEEFGKLFAEWVATGAHCP